MAFSWRWSRFDALSYHLARPQRCLNGTGNQPSSVPHFWFPALLEGLFLWEQGLGAVRTTQLLHLTLMATMADGAYELYRLYPE